MEVIDSVEKDSQLQQTQPEKQSEKQLLEKHQEENGIQKAVDFEVNIRAFFNICKKINTAYQQKSLVITQNFIYESFESFVNIYDKINDPLKTFPVFEEVYNNRKINILSQNENWISNQLIIEYPRVKKVKKKISIFVSIFFSKAKELAESAHKEIFEFNDDKNADNLHLVQRLKLPLLKIFLLCCQEDEKKILKKYISELESELPSSASANSKTPGQPFNPADLFSQLNSGNLGGLGSMLGGLIGNMTSGQNTNSRGRGKKSGRGKSRSGHRPQRKRDQSEKSEKSQNGDENGNEKDKEHAKEESKEEDIDIDEDIEKLESMIGDVLRGPAVGNVAKSVIRKFKGADLSSGEGIGTLFSDLLGDEDLRESLASMMPKPVSEEEAQEMIEEAEAENDDKSEDGDEGEAEDGEESEAENSDKD